MNRILPVIFILLAGCIIFLYVNPTYTGDIATARQKIASYDKAIQASKSFNAKEGTLMSERNSIAQTDLDRLSAFLPDNVDNVQLILDLSALAAKSGIVLTGFTIDTPEGGSQSGSSTGGPGGTPIQGPGGGTGSPDLSASAAAGSPSSVAGLTHSLSLSLTATGTYDAFQNFLRAAEQSLRLLDVTSLSVTANSPGVYTYTIVFRLYWLQ